jgi:hypothetical protein
MHQASAAFQFFVFQAQAALAAPYMAVATLAVATQEEWAWSALGGDNF